MSLGVLTSPENDIHGSGKKWDENFRNAKVHVQWDTERNHKGAPLSYYSIQVGLSRNIITEYAEDWTVKIEDMTSLVHKLNKLRKEGSKNFSKYLPPEKVDPISEGLGRHLKIKETETLTKKSSRCKKPR